MTENSLNPNILLKIKTLAYYQIAGGVVGLIFTIPFFIMVISSSGSLFLVTLIFAFLFLFSAFCGQQLLKGKIERGLKLSTINQAFQIFSFAFAGYSFVFTAGIYMGVSIDLTEHTLFLFNFSLPEMHLNFNSDSKELMVGINFVAAYFIYFIDKLQKKIALDQELFFASKKAQEELKKS